MNETVVTLEIQGAPIQCSRTDLIQNSDYFKAMFEGNFIESEKKVITLNVMRDVVASLSNNLLIGSGA